MRLIERKKQGQGRPDMIYVKNFAIEEVEESVEKVSEVCNVNPNNTENNNTNINYINPILSIYTEDVIDGMDEYLAYSEIIRENIDMDSLMQRYPYEQKDVQVIYELIVETVVGKGGSMTKVYNIKAYLLAALLNAGTTMSNYYRAEVNHDMPQFAG